MVTMIQSQTPLLSLDMPLTEMFEVCPNLVNEFIHRNMGCVGCSMARFDTIKDAAINYGYRPDKFLLELITLCTGTLP